MKQNMKSFGIGHIILALFVLMITTFLVNTANAGTASAATGCGVNSNNIHDYAGVIVNSRYKVEYVNTVTGATTTVWGQSNNTAVKIKTYGATTTPPGGVISLNTGQHYDERTFSQVRDDNCRYSFGASPSQGGSDNTNVILGTGGSSPDTTSGATNWALDCDNSIRKNRPDLNEFQMFQVTGVGRPSGVPSSATGGTWEVKPIAPPNGKTTHITITYSATVRETPPPAKDSPVPTCTQFRRAMTPNSRYHFSYFARGYGNSPTNAGPPMTSPRSTLPADGRWNNYSAGAGYQARETNITTENNSTVHSYNLPSPPDENWRGWRVIIEKWQKQSDDKWHFDSTYVDINCPVWILTPNSSVNAPYVEQGNNVVFSHSITNTGNAVASGISRCTVIGGACADGFSGGIATGVNPIVDNAYAVQSSTGIPFGTDICQAYSVSERSFLNSNATTSAPACARVVGGKTSISITSNTGNVEPSETKQATIQLTTTGFQGHPEWGGYLAGCNYILSGASSPRGGNCSAQVNADGSPPSVAVSYTPTNADIGRQICVVATLTIGNANFYANPAARTVQHCFRVITRPYIQAIAGDVSAGCQGNNASILSWNRNGSAGFAGAGGSYAVYAYNKILGFAAGQNIPSSEGYGNAPANLAFGNTETAAIGSGSYTDGTYGGGYVDNCTPNYYDTKPAGTVAWTDINSMALSVKKNFSTNGSVTISGGQVPIATNARLYVNGDVYIGGNITAQPGLVENLAHVPNFTIIAKGNVYIGANVTNLYGGFLAGNQIVTCANSNYTPKMLASVGTYNECRMPLTVTGSLVAKKIQFLRTNGSLLANQPAEVVKYNPLASFMQSASSDTEHNAAYDAITTLPPVL